MKGTLIIIVLFFVVSSVLGELTKADLQAIENIIDKSEARTKEYIDSKHNQVATKFDEMDKRLVIKFDGVDQRLVDMRAYIIAIISLIGLVVVAIIGHALTLGKLLQDSNKTIPRQQTNRHIPVLLDDPKVSSDLHAD